MSKKQSVDAENVANEYSVRNRHSNTILRVVLMGIYRSYLVTEKTLWQFYKRDLTLLWNNIKSYIAFKWDEKFSRVPRSCLLTGEISVTDAIFVPYEHNFPAYRENFLFTLYKIYVTAGNFTRQAGWHFSIKTEQNYLTWRNVFSR